VFDNDGTLWCEKPMPIQLDFTLRRHYQGDDAALRVRWTRSGGVRRDRRRDLRAARRRVLRRCHAVLRRRAREAGPDLEPGRPAAVPEREFDYQDEAADVLDGDDLVISIRDDWETVF
jgi:hypothetical protein